MMKKFIRAIIGMNTPQTVKKKLTIIINLIIGFYIIRGVFLLQHTQDIICGRVFLNLKMITFIVILTVLRLKIIKSI